MKPLELTNRYGPLAAGVYLGTVTLLRILGQVEAAASLEENRDVILNSLASLTAAALLLWGAVRKTRNVWKHR